MTNTHTAPKFTAEAWAAFWAAPDPSHIGGLLAEGIVGHWPGDPKPARGRADYLAKIAGVVEALPDLRLQLVDSATVAGDTDGEELIFLHYTGTAADGAVTIRGMDRVRTRDGIVVENVIRYDLSEL
ncbi:nuclear transport factor 2 family protein [Mycolicibacterium diernhoferi]|uniref:Nuclear transport factor 2 family protein n=1 Tax=Mycolicibacterium diernhoferi TaxID=1801 RepID=A0A1Q4HD13_9MYCO|nr:nuclear transport factor 2 family protein [Mycolicibacterium diernhoferi]OJZ65424.1 polyketide cyclase [Mycolicibacterium diernhoferi]OPE55607.1 polyketide cyclase [Mycolicibacterium diernhoferi]PEG52913.1 nuclear transport factor 2 family protein [Mycolicibacterium diernhoferi]QYL22155.1 nuclear transport factor 2 family protein [Mycolicibacterium diernhoferi]